LSHLPDLFDDPGWVGKFPRFLFRIDERSVDHDFEDAAGGRNQLEAGDVPFELENFLSQADRLRFIVSDRAVFDGNFHVRYGAAAGAARQPGRADAAIMQLISLMRLA
jgi:hypothetical protein